MDIILPLKNRQIIADDTMMFELDLTGVDFSFKAGQNCDFTIIDPIENDEKGNTRTFSIANSPNDRDSLIFASRMRSSAFKNNLRNMPLGKTMIKVDGPLGSFTLHKNELKTAVFLTGGIGITPFRSIVEWATQEKLPHKIDLFYSDKTESSIAFLKNFEVWQKMNPRFEFIPTLTKDEDNKSWKYERGRISEQMLRKYLPIDELNKSIFYISGPPAMVASMREVLSSLGTDEDNIKTEEFSGY